MVERASSGPREAELEAQIMADARSQSFHSFFSNEELVPPKKKLNKSRTSESRQTATRT